MKLDDYRKADCTLFRLPPINLESIGREIEEILIKAWQDGYSPQQAVENLASSSVAKKLQTDISENLKFKRDIVTKDATAEEKEKRADLQKELKEKLRKIDSQYKDELTRIEREKSEEESAYMATLQNHDAASKNLEEMRGRVKAKLKEVGGEKGYRTLIQINSALTETKPEKKSETREVSVPATEDKSETSENQSYFPIPDSTISTPEKAPEKKITLEEGLDYLEKSRGPRKTIVKKLWEVLNYKVW